MNENLPDNVIYVDFSTKTKMVENDEDEPFQDFIKKRSKRENVIVAITLSLIAVSLIVISFYTMSLIFVS